MRYLLANHVTISHHYLLQTQLLMLFFHMIIKVLFVNSSSFFSLISSRMKVLIQKDTKRLTLKAVIEVTPQLTTPPTYQSSLLALLQSLSTNVTEESLIAFATLAASWSKSYQGYTLNNIEMDSYTATEVRPSPLLSWKPYIHPLHRFFDFIFYHPRDDLDAM